MSPRNHDTEADDDDEDDLLLLVSHQDRILKDLASIPRTTVWYRCQSRHVRRRLNNQIPRCALLPPDKSAWATLYASGSDSALITATGFDHVTFDKLLSDFKIVYDSYRMDSITGMIVPRLNPHMGRPRLLDAAGCLGLTLMWTRTKGADWSLCMHFGLTHTCCSRLIRFGRHILLNVLKNSSSGRIQLPSESEIEEYIAAVAQRHPLLGEERVWAAMDGLKLLLEAAGDPVVQNMFFNGWTHDHYVTCVFLFAPDGTIVAMVINAPGTFHDSLIADWGKVYQKCERMNELYGGKVAVDSAFCARRGNFLIKSSQNTNACKKSHEYKLQREATSMRQTSEWGMRGMQGSFPRLKDRIKYEEGGERRIILELCARLYNFRAREVGINQIRTVYMPNLEDHLGDEVF